MNAPRARQWQWWSAAWGFDVAELEQIEAALLRVKDGGRDTEVAEASRRGAATALAADRGQWRRIVNTLRRVSEHGYDLSAGRAYFKGQKLDRIPGADCGPGECEGR